MLRHAARAVPWTLVVLASLLVVGLLGAVRYDQWVLWPLQGVAVGLLAAAVGWCLDEPAAAVVDAAPRGLPWRTLARGSGVAALLAVWSGSVWGIRSALFGHPWEVWGQGVGAAAVTTAFVTWRRTLGESTPGQRWALGVVPVAAAWALVRPLPSQVPVFPYAYRGYGDWAVSAAGWGFVAVVAVVALVACLVAD